MGRLLGWVGALFGAALWLWGDVGWPAGPEAQVMAVVRVVAAVLATWLLVATTLAILGRVLHVGWLGRLAPVAVRKLVAGALAGGLLVTPVAAGATATRTAPPGVEAPVLERLGPIVPAPAPAPVPPPAAAAPEAPAAVRPRTHVVEPGDHLWRIAAAEVAARLGRRPDDAEIVPYWRELMDANRRIAPDPDVIRPGQEIDLPS